MHDIKSIRDNPDAFDAALKRRGLEPLSASLLAIDEKRRAAILASEQAQARRNSASKEIGEAKKARDDARAAALMAEVAELKTTMPQLEAAAKAADEELARELAAIPNLPLDEVPEGADEHGNVQRHVFGAVRNYAFAPKPHFDLGEAMGYMDFEAAAKLSGARFVVLKKGLARLERAIGQFMLDLHTNEHGYAEVNPPLLVRDPRCSERRSYRNFVTINSASRRKKCSESTLTLTIARPIGGSRLCRETNGIGAARREKVRVGEFDISPRIPTASGSFPLPKYLSQTSSANPSSTKKNYRCA